MTFDDYLANYRRKTSKSRRLFDRACKVFPGGISHNIRFFEPYPFFVDAAKGKTLHDVDGNRYTDYWMGHWALILGHSPPNVANKLAWQVKRGTLYGTVNEASVKLAETIQQLVPSAEMLRFSSTGSEATMYATRLARAKTGRRVIAKVIGGWHGFNTTLMQSVNYPFEVDEGPGLVEEDGQFIESIPFNDLEGSLKTLETIKDDLACVIVEPLLGGAGCIPAQKEYLEGLQEFCKRAGGLFILDEIVTGFRLSIQGATGTYRLDPDLITLGKIVGGGMPIGVVCGRREIMSLADPVLNKDKQARCAIGGGTFSANPVTMMAGLATIDYLKRNKERVYSKIDRLGAEARQGLTKIFSENKIACEVTGTGSVFLTHFLSNKVNKITNALDVALSNREMLSRYHRALIASYGIFFLPTKMGAFSFAHNVQDVKNLLSTTSKIVESKALA